MTRKINLGPVGIGAATTRRHVRTKPLNAGRRTKPLDASRRTEPLNRKAR